MFGFGFGLGRACLRKGGSIIVGTWLLLAGVWNDTGTWDDAATWNDGV
jgi:hypothetical protein